MRVLVTGGSGFLGQHVVALLTGRGDDVRVVDLKPYPDERIDCVVGDLRERTVVEKALTAGFDAVVHLAAITSVLQSMNDPEGVYATNVEASQLLLERCRVLGIKRFVFASTNAVVGNVGSRLINEEIPLQPLTPYGGTKAAVEMMLSAYDSSYGVSSVALRFTNLYGVGMQPKDSVIARLMRAALSDGGIEIYGDGEQVRDYLYVTDAARAIELALDLPESNTLTIGNGRSYSMNELYELTKRATGKDIGATHIPGKPGEMPAVIVDTAKARSVGFEPTVDVLDGLKATWEDFVARHP